MTELVLMSPNNGALCVGIPLYTSKEIHIDENTVKMFISSGEPLAYAIDIGEKNMTFINAKFVENNLINLGEL